jgi:hypothetical protein
MVPRIILVKDNGQRIFIDCNQVPPQGGGPGTLEIPNVEIRTHNEPGNVYNYLYFPQGTAGPEQPGDLVILLKGPLHENNLVLPLNGGQIPALPPNHPNEVTVKLNV